MERKRFISGKGTAKRLCLEDKNDDDDRVSSRIDSKSYSDEDPVR